MELTLYYAPLTCALIPYVPLIEAGAAFEGRNDITRANQHRTPEFLALDRKHFDRMLLKPRVQEVPAHEKQVQDAFVRAA
jgi:glutathione S-transferase